MRAYRKVHLKRFVNIALMVLVLLSFAACGNSGRKRTESDVGQRLAELASASNSPKAEATPPATNDPGEVEALAVHIPGGLNLDDAPGAMFAVVLGDPAGMGEPAKELKGYFPEEGEPNYSFSLIPLRDGVQISIETIYVHDLHFSDLPYMDMDQVTGKLGEYYRVDTFVKPQPDLYMCVRIVAQDGAEQGAFLLDPVQRGDSGEFVIFPGKIPDGLSDAKVNLLSGIAAGAVWRFGRQLGWVDEQGETKGLITPTQLAVSQAACQTWIHNIIGMIDYGNLEEPYYSSKAAQYASVLFPGVALDDLPKTDELAYENSPYDPWVDTTEVLFSGVSADGKTGHVIVRIPYVKGDAEFEDYYRVDWEADGPYDVYRPFMYKLVGVQPLMRYFMGHGEPYEYYSERFLGAESVEPLQKLGIAHAPGYIDTPGVWGHGGMTLLRAIGTDGGQEIETYVLLDDDDKRVVYLGAFFRPRPEPGSFYAQQTQADDQWTDLGILRIPSAWSYETHILDDIVIEGETPRASFSMWAGWLMADSIESVVQESLSSERFVFYDGHVGYMLFFDTYISWVREDWMSLNLNHGGDVSSYWNDEDLILEIARSLTTNE